MIEKIKGNHKKGFKIIFKDLRKTIKVTVIYINFKL